MPIIETLGVALVTCGIPVLLLLQLNEQWAMHGWPTRRSGAESAPREE